MEQDPDKPIQPPLIPEIIIKKDGMVVENTGQVIIIKKADEGETIIPLNPPEKEPEKKWWEH